MLRKISDCRLDWLLFVDCLEWDRLLHPKTVKSNANFCVICILIGVFLVANFDRFKVQISIVPDRQEDSYLVYEVELQRQSV